MLIYLVKTNTPSRKTQKLCLRLVETLV